MQQTPPKHDRLGLISGGWYATSLQPYHDTFGDQLLVVFQEDIDVDPHAFYRRAAEHIGATREFVLRSSKRCGSATAQRPGIDRDRISRR